MRVTASAPGKLVLLGEYAVLEGAPALVMAVDRRARVTLTETTDGGCIIDAPSLDIRGARCRLHDGRIGWSNIDADAADRLELVGAIIEAANPPLPPCRATLDTDAFFVQSGGSKLGLGSSAALTVAFSGAIQGLRGEPAPRANELIALHRDMQGGRGSGIDIAASLHGGVIEYHMGGKQPGITPLRLPDSLGVACVWSGHSASTGAFLQQVELWRERAPADYSALMRRLEFVAGEGVAAVGNNDAEAFLDAARTYAQTLAELGRASGTAIMTPEHVEIAAMAADCGVTYKTCGAGGGDVGVAFATDRDRLTYFSRRLARAGYRTLDLARDARGLAVSRPDKHQQKEVS